MELLNEIRDTLATVRPGKAIKLESLDIDCPAWAVRFENEYGVAVPLEQDIEISEHFSSARIWNTKIQPEGTEKNLLMLTCSDESLRIEFASVCAQFVEPGPNLSNRKVLCLDPVAWWKKWRLLLGNSVKEKKAYSVIGELLAYENLLKKGQTPVWMGPDAASHDIELEDSSFEVKSTIGRYSSLVTISGQHQLQNLLGKSLALVFYRFEASPYGFSINDIVNRISANKQCTEELNVKLSKIGYEPGATARNEKYSVLEKRKYVVNDEFPKITAESFTGGRMPDAVVQISYTVDLSSLSYETWD